MQTITCDADCRDQKNGMCESTFVQLKGGRCASYRPGENAKVETYVAPTTTSTVLKPKSRFARPYRGEVG
jgi:hypothetical protein